MSFSFYNCYDEFFKSPFGAVPQNTAVRFRLRVPSDYGCTTPYLVLTRDGGKPVLHPLEKESEKDGAAVFSVVLSLPDVGLYFYYFDLYTEFRKIWMGEQGEGRLSVDAGQSYQLTVYEASFYTPARFYGGVMYQIFPDRFFEGKANKPMPWDDRIYRGDKDGEPYFWPNELGGYLNRDYYGGDFEGIRQKLPFLSSLGVTCIYLNPIFEAHSNHRYNTADYKKADPLLGTNQEFAALCAAAHKAGIKIILDGVFSHTGSDSIYFDKEKRYGGHGAYHNTGSPYRSWYDFSPHYKDGYRCWWGFPSLPEVNETDPGYRNFICGKGGVIDTWMELGADGFRLDVADELPDDFIEAVRKAVKRHGEDKLLLGEVWEDATNKWSYAKRRTYLLGKGLDSVMNYPFRNAVLQFVREGDAAAAAGSIMEICDHYPAPALHALMNFLSTHDTERAVTAIADEPCDGRDRYWQSGRRLPPDRLEYGKLCLRLAFALLFFLPGVPCVYYGDEQAMEGYKDPFNRAYYPWDETDGRLVCTVRALSSFRARHPVFKTGGLRFTCVRPGLLCLERFSGEGRAALCVNRTCHAVKASLLGETVMVAPFQFAMRARDAEKAQNEEKDSGSLL